MKTNTKILSGFLIASVMTPAFAGKQTGKIDILYARAHDNLHLVSLKEGSERSGHPTCATNNYWLIKDENSVTGQSQFSQLLAAQLAGKTVQIVGSNTCSRWGNGEDINTIVIKD